MPEYYLNQEDAEKTVDLPCGCSWTYKPEIGSGVWELNDLCEEHDPTIRTISDPIPVDGKEFDWHLSSGAFVDTILIETVHVALTGKEGVTFRCFIRWIDYDEDSPTYGKPDPDNDGEQAQIFVKYDDK